jgi:hypothetical protein
MYPAFIQLETRLRMAEEWLAAKGARRASETRGRIGPTVPPRVPAPREPDPAQDLGITIRLSTTEDRPAILRLAELDGRKPPAGEMLLAIVCGELRVALALENRETIADPFFPTAGLVDLLRVRETNLHATGVRGGTPLRRRLAFAWR